MVLVVVVFVVVPVFLELVPDFVLVYLMVFVFCLYYLYHFDYLHQVLALLQLDYLYPSLVHLHFYLLVVVVVHHSYQLMPLRLYKTDGSYRSLMLNELLLSHLFPDYLLIGLMFFHHIHYRLHLLPLLDYVVDTYLFQFVVNLCSM